MTDNQKILQKREEELDSDEDQNLLQKPKWVPISKRKEWEDVVPITQKDGPKPPCVVNYSDQYKETMNYFRAVLRSEEISERALKLSKELLMISPSYTVAYEFRRNCLFALNGNLKNELFLIEKLLDRLPKNYQLWHHRMKCVEKLNDYSNEMDFLARMMLGDAKNYHVWVYRIWLVKHFQLWDNELEFIEGELEKDHLNNSFWNYRYYVVTKSKTIPLETIYEQEFEFVFGHITKSVNNESPWVYIMNFIKILNKEQLKVLHDKVDELRKRHRYSMWPLFCLFTLYTKYLITEENLDNALTYAKYLAERYDQTRKKYWGKQIKIVENQKQKL
ncbi:protein farnesyltransferase/geranylgeranyltransferase type-1 subunit alpha [Anaeramoeba flamelloides]|uniref:Protein farnesyltransferase/geranylgeranyltransferase type-1 subunit alpha n=1 Tax=Anaeramoeba flamelloides TaxID=1746091 RepID=A0AAV7YPT8_9EUKA|nr:protein farnesyltransferase/geranylgeranyltransferase type-1 subunit alpha [Anaeramoeba flamelloides]